MIPPKRLSKREYEPQLMPVNPNLDVFHMNEIKTKMDEEMQAEKMKVLEQKEQQARKEEKL